MFVANFVKDLFGRAGTSMGYVIKPLSDTLFRISARRDVQKTLVGFRILHDSSGLSIHREHDRTFALPELLHEVTGPAAEASQRLNVFGHVEHDFLRFKAPLKVLSE
jgi:hypothetical protein